MDEIYTAPRPLGLYRDQYLDCEYNRRDPEISRAIDQYKAELRNRVLWIKKEIEG
ncbi:hypothetical protein SEA_ANON_97 [Gordonia phage Anon]|nr:hypothetical protein SEA_ANON_97 [Gordonia phage Anon]